MPTGHTPTKVEINEGTYNRLYDRISKTTKTVVFTDGSFHPDTKKTGSAILYGKNNHLAWPAIHKSVSFSSEMEALDKALTTSKSDIIF